jgi:DNA integrity scanning protein DisA with diadenylate cyclase activity
MTIGAVQALCSRIRWCEPAVLESSLELALEIAREGREGRRIGTLFTVGRADEVARGIASAHPRSTGRACSNPDTHHGSGPPRNHEGTGAA